jgi:GNAT superfamily N-acetyltransferase
MILRTAASGDVARLKELWNENFDDGTPGFCDFIFSKIPPHDIFIADCDGERQSMVMAAAKLEFNGRSGTYFYSACTDEKHRGKGLMHKVIAFAEKNCRNRGDDFFILLPASDSLYDFYKDMGYNTVHYLRKANIPINKNIWQSSKFDITTANRFKEERDKFFKDKIVHYSNSDCEKFAEYLYTFGGSTAESDSAFAVYNEDFGKLNVKELLGKSSGRAISLLQSVRERTGYEEATIYLPYESEILLGEGEKVKYAASKGLDYDVYVNLMFE